MSREATARKQEPELQPRESVKGIVRNLAPDAGRAKEKTPQRAKEKTPQEILVELNLKVDGLYEKALKDGTCIQPYRDARNERDAHVSKYNLKKEK